MSKTIPSLPSGGSQRLINTPGSNPVGGINLPPAASMPSWNRHDPIAAAGQNSAVPNVTVQPPAGAIPGKPMPRPTNSEQAFPVAGRQAGIDRDSQ